MRRTASAREKEDDGRIGGNSFLFMHAYPTRINLNQPRGAYPSIRHARLPVFRRIQLRATRSVSCDPIRGPAFLFLFFDVALHLRINRRIVVATDYGVFTRLTHA